MTTSKHVCVGEEFQTCVYNVFMFMDHFQCVCVHACVKQPVCMPHRCGMVMHVVVMAGKPLSKSVISHNHNSHRMAAGEESSQTCNQELEQEFNQRSVSIIFYPAFNLLY